MSEFKLVRTEDRHREAFNRNKQKIADFYKLDLNSLQLVEVAERNDNSINSYCEFVVKDKTNKTAILKIDCLRTETKWTGQQNVGGAI